MTHESVYEVWFLGGQLVAKEWYCFGWRAPSLEYWSSWSFGRQHFGYQWCSTINPWKKSLREDLPQQMGKFLYQTSITLSTFTLFLKCFTTFWKYFILKPLGQGQWRCVMINMDNAPGDNLQKTPLKKWIVFSADKKVWEEVRWEIWQNSRNSLDFLWK